MSDVGMWFDTARQIATKLLPTCELCSAPNALPIECTVCGRNVCLEHAFLKKSFVLVCDECMERALASLTDTEGHPWDILGVTPPCSEVEVQRAFRQISMLLHPDRLKSASSTVKEQSARLWALVQRARTDALEIIRRVNHGESDNHQGQ